jgi:hypothetical protein
VWYPTHIELPQLPYNINNVNVSNINSKISSISDQNISCMFHRTSLIALVFKLHNVINHPFLDSEFNVTVISVVVINVTGNSNSSNLSSICPFMFSCNLFSGVGKLPSSLACVLQFLLTLCCLFFHYLFFPITVAILYTLEGDIIQ